MMPLFFLTTLSYNITTLLKNLGFVLKKIVQRWKWDYFCLYFIHQICFRRVSDVIWSWVPFWYGCLMVGSFGKGSFWWVPLGKEFFGKEFYGRVIEKMYSHFCLIHSSEIQYPSTKCTHFEFFIALWKGTRMKRIQDTYLQKPTIHLVLDKHLSLKPKWHFHFPHHQVELAASPT